jgi:ribosome-binding protein aMBF1 (putative translation factor)
MTIEKVYKEAERCPTCGRSLPLNPDLIPSIREQIGENIRKHRVAAGMSQEEVAANFDPPLARAILTRTENGQQRIELDRLIMIASIIGVDWRVLLEIGEQIPAE